MQFYKELKTFPDDNLMIIKPNNKKQKNPDILKKIKWVGLSKPSDWACINTNLIN